MRSKGWAVAAIAILLLIGAIEIAWLNPRLTHYVESDRFRAELEKETAKGPAFSQRTLINTGLQAGAFPLAMKMSCFNGLSTAGRTRKAVETAHLHRSWRSTGLKAVLIRVRLRTT